MTQPPQPHPKLELPQSTSPPQQPISTSSPAVNPTMATSQDAGAVAAPSAANSAQDNSANTPKPAENVPSKPDPQASGKNAKGPAPAKEEEAGEKKLSGAELKKKAKAEKAARRAKEKLEREQQGGATGAPQGGQQQQQQNQPSSSKKGGPGGKGGTPTQSQKKDKQQQQTGGKKDLPIRHGSIQSSVVKEPEDTNIVAVFDHLASQKRRSTISGAGKDIHPAILALGLQMTDYVVCGSSARCVATMLALKRVVESYNTPIGTSLTRHLTSHLSHDINYLTLCRPLSVSQGNAIRALKLAIASIDPSSPETEAKKTICDFIDNFIREKITIAGQVIADKAAQKIEDGDVILCYANSNVIRKTLLKAHSQGKKFSVSIVDSRPLFEGKKLARTLADAGLTVRYTLIHGLSHAVRDATKVLLGAHSMTSNGRLFSRVGTALVAMSAKERAGGINIPVIVCCETVKFTDRVALDSIVVNELAGPDDLVASEPTSQVTGLHPAPKPETNKSKKSVDTTNDLSVSSENKSNPLEDWRAKPNLQVLNIMYDVTPADYVDMIITEMGSLPPSSVPVVHRMSTNP